MSSKLNVETFVAVLKKSGLIESDRLQRLAAEYAAQGGSPDDSPKMADFLVAHGTITRWQSEKLLQGKHKGYFLGKYRLLSLLGKGGMSSVYLAEHVLMRRRCALKVLPTKRVHDSSYLARFHREAQAVASLDHPNIVRAYDVDHQVDRDNEIHFLVMEYVEGFSLQELVQNQGVCGFCDAAEYIRQSALGLHHAHEAGMVHRDVKPGNLLVDPNGVVKVLDLGLARFFTGDEDEDALTIRHDEKVLGTADYLAPEQALDSHTVDARADIYGLGCTFFFLLTGRPPFTEGTLAQRLMAHQTKTPPSVESLRPDMPLSLAVILRKMMAKKADDRYATGKDNADALFAWIDANADIDWRKAHSGIFGTRPTDSSGDRMNIPIAKPILAMPVAAPVATAPPAPVIQTPVAQAPLVPASASQFIPPPASETAAPAPVDAELSNFFAALSDSQNALVRPAPASTPKQPTPQPVPPQAAPPPAAITVPAPPHLKPPSSMKLKTPAATPMTESAFPDFSAMSATIPPVVVAKSAPPPPKPPVPPEPARSKLALPKMPSFDKLRLPVPIMAGIGGGVVVLLLIAAYALGWFGGGNSKSKIEQMANLPPWPAEKREVTVGGSGEFKSIVDALKVVRRRFEPSGAPNDQMVIKIAAGTYRENISIDGTPRRTSRREKKGDKPADPDWPQGIKLLADGEVILEAPQDVPAIRLKNIQKFVVEGITINATAKAVGVEVTGDMMESRLTGLKISGFTQTGLACLSAHGFSFINTQFVLEKLTLETAATSAVGIRLQRADEVDPGDVIIRNCRLIGPMAAGIAISGKNPNGITVVENIFTKVQDSLRFEGTAQWRNLAVLNNTFHEGRHGIVFTNMPEAGSLGLSFRRNLFSKMTAAEGIVQSGYDEARLGTTLTTDRPGWELNYSDRPKPATPQAGEINPLCDKRGEQGIAFASTDAKNAKFLAPSDKGVQRNVPGAKEGEKNWVGAIGP